MTEMLKRILYLFLILSSLTSFSQVELKGVKLGEKGQPDSTYVTVGGVKGYIITSKLKDGRCYKITFINTASFENRKENFSNYSEVIQSIDGFLKHFKLESENKYDVIDLNSEDNIKGVMMRDKGKVSFFISVVLSTNLYLQMNPNLSLENDVYMLSYVITNNELNEFFEQQAKEDIINDY
jgi:hypothetical protein